jgi:hypothetical protein
MTETLAPATTEELQQRIVELFGEVCAKPDDADVAAAADEALRKLDAILEAQGTPA